MGGEKRATLSPPLREVVKNFFGVPEETLKKAEKQAHKGEGILSRLVKMGVLSEDEANFALFIHSGAKYPPLPSSFKLRPSDGFDSRILEKMRKEMVLIHFLDESHPIIVTSNPNPKLLDEYVNLLVAEERFSPKIFLAMESRIKEILWAEELFDTEEASATGEKLKVTPTATEKLLRQMIEAAVRYKASDIHIGPRKEGKFYATYFRVDGRRVRMKEFTMRRQQAEALINKIRQGRAEKNISGPRPVDGAWNEIVLGQKINIRMNIVPVTNGYSVALRLFSPRIIPMEETGMDPDQIELLRRAIQGSGIILFTGPTGSGKNTSIYSALREIDRDEKKIISIEEPVEYALDGTYQIEVQKPNTWESLLQAALRQDPDVMYIAEIRDPNSAKIALEAALTGHLVISTVHASKTTNVFERLSQLGIEPYNYEFITLVVGQRLLLRVCHNCAQEKMKIKIGPQFVEGYKKGKGCPACLGRGEIGRVGVFEFLPVDDRVRTLAMEGKTSQLDNMLLERGADLISRALAKFEKGIISYETFYRLLLEVGPIYGIFSLEDYYRKRRQSNASLF